LHLHLFTFGPLFRVHCGIRVLNDAFDAAALNGPSSDDFRTNPQDTYSLGFADDDASVAKCANEIARFASDVAEPWFERFGDVVLLVKPDSPLDEQERHSLEQALSGQADLARVEASKQLLGVA
jgi:hypothetical protein